MHNRYHAKVVDARWGEATLRILPPGTSMPDTDEDGSPCEYVTVTVGQPFDGLAPLWDEQDEAWYQAELAAHLAAVRAAAAERPAREARIADSLQRRRDGDR